MAPAGKATGFFSIRKLGNRWYFLSPEGHPFWMRAVYAINLLEGGEATSSQTLRTKYQNDWNLFAQHAVKKLRLWGFNALGEYSSAYTYPVATYLRPSGNPNKMPFIRLLNLSYYGTFNQGHLAPAPFKTLLAGAVDPQIYKDWPGNIPDVFDPNFEVYAKNVAAELKAPKGETIFTEKSPNGGAPHPSLATTPWLIGTTPDDTDYLFGFGPGPEQPGRRGVVHPHIAWVIAVTRPEQTANTEIGSAFGERQTIRYDDTVVYAKRAWRDFLQQEYKAIESLNSAWGSKYTTFDSDGGWPGGKGLLDESGHNPWIGSNPTGPFSSSRVAADLDKFLGVFADRYFRIVSQAIRAATPHHLVFGPAPLNSHSGMTRRPILEAAGRYCDVIQTDFRTEKLEILDATYSITGKPMFVWMGTTANKDSAFHAYERNETLTTESQKERAALYRREVEWLFAYQTHAGVHPMIGLEWWEYMDKWAEKAAWGLVSPRDNAYDGKEAIKARGKDAWNFPTGGEDRDYGDFLSVVAQTNLAIDKTISALLPRANPPATDRKPPQKKLK
ncbi:MAG TPA: hypothetical protein VOA41_20035 [Candidatus Dormibacteraeota bacterium]|nr:hypothetical protein [Candidatus Dormibacteraeota bacterium]